MLAEDKRAQLDGIVQKMTQNNESFQNIQTVVGDFKKKYETQDTPLTPPEPQQSFLSKVASGIGDFLSTTFTGMPLGMGKGLAKSVGSTAVGTAQLAQKAGKATGLIPAGDTDIQQPEFLQPKGLQETIGKTAGDIGQFFLPGPAEAKVATKLEDLVNIGKFAEAHGPEAAKTLQGILGVLSHGVTTAGSTAGVTALQTGGDAGATIAGGIAGMFAPAVGKILEAAGEGVGKVFIPKSETEAKMLQNYKASTPFLDRVRSVLGLSGAKAPTTAGSAAFSKGLLGSESMLGVQAKRAQTSLWKNLISPALEQSSVKVDMPTFLNQAEKQITQEVKDPTRLNTLKKALESIKEDFSGIGKVKLKDLQNYKEGWAEFVPEKAYKGEPISGALNDVRNTLAGMARDTIYNALGNNVKQAYLDYGSLNGITALGRKAMTGAIKGPAGTTLKNILEMATIPIGTIGGQTIYKVGEGVEVFGRAGGSNLRDILSPSPGSGDTSSSESAQ